MVSKELNFKTFGFGKIIIWHLDEGRRVTSFGVTLLTSLAQGPSDSSSSIWATNTLCLLAKSANSWACRALALLRFASLDWLGLVPAG